MIAGGDRTLLTADAQTGWIPELRLTALSPAENIGASQSLQLGWPRHISKGA